MENNCTVIVSSCDKYEDTWYPFFKILKEEWPDRPYPIVLITESKSFDYEDMNIRTLCLYKPDQRVSWGRLLKRTLMRINTEYILFMLDDFFLFDRVDQKRIEQCIDWMDNDKNIAVFSFYRTHQPNIRDNKYPHFEKRPLRAEYRLNCQAAIWRRKKLISYIRSHENPWQWEILGSVRSSRYKEDFYSAIKGEPYVFKYLPGGGIRRGKWAPEIKELFERHAIKIDYSKRGLYFKDTKKQNKSKKNIIWFIKKIKEKIIRWRSIL